MCTDLFINKMFIMCCIPIIALPLAHYNNQPPPPPLIVRTKNYLWWSQSCVDIGKKKIIKLADETELRFRSKIIAKSFLFSITTYVNSHHHCSVIILATTHTHTHIETLLQSRFFFFIVMIIKSVILLKLRA